MLEVFNRVQMLADENRIPISTLQEKLGIGKRAIYRWKTGTVPKVDTLMKVADFFGVSIDFLMGRTDYRAVVVVEKPTSPRAWKLAHKIETAGYSDEQIETIESFIEYAEEFNEGEDE